MFFELLNIGKDGEKIGGEFWEGVGLDGANGEIKKLIVEF